jgi:23S rRNA pseudouridine1911/1915/1917 synthase
MADIYTLHKLSIDDPGAPLFAAIATAIPGLSRHQARLAVAAGLVKVQGQVERGAKVELPAKARVEVDLRHGVRKPFLAKVHKAPAPNDKPFTILHQDDALVIVDKVAGVLSAPSARGERGHVPELLRRALRKRGQEPRFLGVVHRLDQDTSGCLCVALTREAQRLLQAQFAEHTAARAYRCLVHGAPRKDEDTLAGKIAHGRYGRRVLLKPGDEDEEDRGKEAVTRFRVLRRFKRGDRDRAAELEVELETGRTHQIRVSLAAIGCPVIGDHVYGFRGEDRSLRPGDQPLPRPPRLLLHAWKLALDHPVTGDRIEVEAPLPTAFADYARLIG